MSASGSRARSAGSTGSASRPCCARWICRRGPWAGRSRHLLSARPALNSPAALSWRGGSPGCVLRVRRAAGRGGQPTRKNVKPLTAKPVYMLINTHTHGDHVSGNVEFPATVDVVTQANTKANMEKMDIFKQNGSRGMAKRTFTDKMKIGSGPDQIDLYYFGPGHTNGDAIVVFRALRTAHTGDLFQAKALPLVDPDNGGSGLHYLETLNKTHKGSKKVDTARNGPTNTTTTWDGL